MAVLHQMIVLSLMMLTGYAGNRFGILSEDSQKWISKLIVNITCPALILNSVTTADRLESGTMLLAIFGTAVAYFILLPLLAKGITVVCRVPKVRRAEYEAMLNYSNMGFMGIPVVGALFGKTAILYLSIFMAVFNISMFSYGFVLLEQREGKGFEVKSLKRMVNPGTVSAVTAVALYALNLQIPTLLLEPIASIGSTTTPLAMLVIGASLANFALPEMFSDKSVILFTVLRLLVLPGITLVIGRLLLADEMLCNVMVIISAMPVASNVVMLCNELGRDGSYVAKGLFFSTLLSVITIPIVSIFL